MEQIENTTENTGAEKPGLYITRDARSFWPGTRAWTLFLGVVGLVAAGFVGLVLVLLIRVALENSIANRGELITVTMLYILAFLILAGFGGLLLWISSRIQLANRYLHTQNIAQYTESIRLYFMIAGIFSILTVLFQVVSTMVLIGD
ncbi:MAG: ABC transporter ATP-binding protein [Lewinellaceae bacterium]|nr:ABC transporter ATP-binding protein [Lewinellaceae bacterium]